MANQQATRLFGLDDLGDLGTTRAQALFAAADDTDFLKRPEDFSGFIATRQFVMQAIDGRPFDAATAYTTVMDAQGEASGIVLFVRDVTVPETIASASTDAVPATTDSKTNVSFINHVMPIFEKRCVKCHGGQQTKEGFDLKTYEGLMAGSFNGPVLEPGNANGSYLVEQIINGEMPKRGPKLTPNDTQIITDWINSGAINN